MSDVMVAAGPLAGPGPAEDRGAWLVEHRWAMDRGESSWLAALGEFDAGQGWAADRQLSGAAWLMWRTGMARPTAYEKLRTAGQLRRRPIVAAAFADGRLSYSAVRAVTRMDDPDPDVDVALVGLAEAGTIADVERAVRFYQLHADQHRPPPDPERRRGLRICRHGDGTTTIEVTLTDLEAEEVAAALQAYLDLSAPPPSPAPAGTSDAPGTSGESPTGDNSDPTGETGEAAEGREESPTGDRSARTGGGVDWPARRADAFVDLARSALAHAGQGHAMGADRYLVHLVHRSTELVDGTPIDDLTAARVACDASKVDFGRKTRVWSTPQRRAILVRDRGICRFPGCEHRITDIHHLLPWSEGGPTEVANGLLVCGRHHTHLHRGFRAEGDTNHTVTFHRPDGTILGTTTPRPR